MDLKRTVSKRVKILRLEMGMTQQELADRAGLHVRYLSRLENKPQNITLEILAKLAAGLNRVPADLVVDGEPVIAPRDSIEALDQAIQLLGRFRTELHTEE